jgi:hypothetical protein
MPPKAAEVVRSVTTTVLVATVTATGMMAGLSFVLVRLAGWLDVPRRTLEMLS